MRRVTILASGVALLALGIFMPRDWYDRLPKKEGRREPPIKGVTLLQICLAVEGLLLAGVAASGARLFEPIPPERLAPPPPYEEDPKPAGALARHAPLALITLLAAALRFWKLGTDLWFDEITTVSYYKDPSPLVVLTTYINSNNHLLNTLLMKASFALFGESEWSARLPAALLGIAAVPLLYWVARRAMSRRASLAAAALLAVSYHHVFFSQNARGYSAHMFFSLAAAGLLCRAIREDRPRDWAMFVGASVLNFAAILHGAFVFVGQMAAGCAALPSIRRRGEPTGPLLRRLVAVGAVAGFLGLDLYATILPQVQVFVEGVYQRKSSGFAPLSSDLAKEVVRSLSAGFGPGLLLGAIPFLALAGWGFWLLLRRDAVFALSLAAPLAVVGGFLAVKAFTFSPRFFILGLPLAILCVAHGAFALGEALASRMGWQAAAAPRLGIALSLLMAVASAASLKGYYAVPKQSYRAAFDRVDELRRPGDLVVAVYLSGWGFTYYGGKRGWEKGRDYVEVRSLEAFQEALAGHPGPGRYLVTTFRRALRLDYPEIDEAIRRDWVADKTFPATVGDGEITIWREKRPPGSGSGA